MNSIILKSTGLKSLKEISNLSNLTILKNISNLNPSKITFNLCKGSLSTSVHNTHTVSPFLKNLDNIPSLSSPNFNQNTIENNAIPPKKYSTSVEEKFEKCMDGNEAAATIAYSINDVAFVYPITPSSVMAECVDNWSASKKINIWGNVVKSIEMESEGGVAGALHGSLSAGALSTSFTSSQGLLLMIPNMFKIAGELLPCVLHVASRAVSTHALSIFGDHSDVMAARSTGWNMLCSDSVQAALDMALVAQMATFQCSLPFIHFFEGFRTSHEISKIKLISNQVIKTLVDQKAIEHFRNRALNPTHPSAKGSNQGPEMFFQNAEAINKYYNQVPDIVEDCMNKLNFAVGRRYNLFDYTGPEDATDVIVVMGSGSYVCQSASEILNQNYGRKTGVLNVRLFRPWSKKHFLEALPSTVERIAVLDRCKENGSIGEPLFTDVCTTLFSEPMSKPIKIIGGRYGIASKDFTPGMAIAVYENLASPNSKVKFTVGIDDDVTNLSLPYKNFDTLGHNVIQCQFWGFGSDGTVGANKDAIKIIGDNTDLYGQAYFAYSAHKSRGITTSHLRFGPEPIHAPYLITSSDYVAVHYPGYISKFDVLSKLKPSGTFVLNTDWPIEELDKHLPYWVKKQLAEKMPKFYIIDANKIANEIGLGERINMIMQSVFFYLAKVIPYKEATYLIKQAIEKTYASKGTDIIQKNKKCVDLAISSLKRVHIPEQWKYVKRDDYFTGIKSLSEYVNNVVVPSHHLRANEIPVSKLPVDGSVEPGTSKYEKLLSSKLISTYDPTKCLQCNKCTLICPHAAIRPVLVSDEKLKEAPQGFITRLLKTKKRKLNYRIQVSPYDCTGCTLCVNICPTKSLVMKPTQQILKTENDNYNFSLSLPTVDNLFKKESIKGSQFQQPLLEFSGACEGCQQTVYVKLLTQLYGDHLIMANATGCSSIWGLSSPTNPFTVNKEGYGPAWANSLFEDNAQFGYGIHQASVQRRNNLKKLMENLIQPDTQIKLSKELKDLIPKWIKTFDDYESNKKISDKIEKLLVNEKSNDPRLEDIYHRRDLLRKITTWIIGGDGWAYDIGYSGVDHVLASGDRVRILVLDTECYSNTGGQASKSTPLGAVQFFSKNGKAVNKKELGLMAMQYRNVYVASVSLAANPNQALKAMIEAENFPGPSIIIAHSPCQLHGIRGGMKNVINEAKLAVDSGYWPLYRYNPLNKDQPFIYESVNIKENVVELLKNENRFSQLIRKNPEYGQELTKKAQQYYLRRHQYLLTLAHEETLKDTSAFTSIQLKPTDHTDIEKLDSKLLSNIEELVILYGTEYGTSEAIAKILMKDAMDHGCQKVTMMEANKFDVSKDFEKTEFMIFICSTTGNGQFPQNAQIFWDKLSKLQGNLPNLKYSVFGLGDSSYAQYCYTAKLVDSRLAELGAKKIYQLTLNDDKKKIPIETNVEKWEMIIFKNLASSKFQNPEHHEHHIDPSLNQLYVIYGNEGGYIDVIVSKILNDVMKSGEYNVHVIEANNVDMEKLIDMNEVIFVTSTTDDGQFTQNALEFWENLSKADERYHELENLKYTILSIEDSSYTRSGEAAHILDDKLRTLGGQVMVKFSSININTDISRQESSYNEWIKQVFKALNISNEKKVKDQNGKTMTSEDHHDVLDLERLDVIYGTETGQSEIAAEMFAEDAERAGVSEVEIHVADKVSLEDFQKMKNVILITSTSGDGEFPPNALEFWDRLSKATPESLSLKDMNYTVYGLGDSSYEKYCIAASLINEKIQELGGNCFYPFSTLDSQSEKDPEIQVRMWIGDVLNKLILLQQEQNENEAANENKFLLNPSHVYVIYGTELGSSERIAKKLSEEATTWNVPEFDVVSADMVKLEDLQQMKNVVFVTSTSGDGEFPPNAIQFWNRLSNATPEDTNLKEMNYAVFGLGDKTYEKFCEASRLINEKVKALGAKSFYPYTTIDDSDITRNQDTEVDDWIKNILTKLKTLNPDWNNNIYGARDDNSYTVVDSQSKKTSKAKAVSERRKELNILFGTQCGLSEDVAALIGEEAQKRGYKVTVSGANQVPMDKFKSMDNVLVVTSTVDGTFPPSIFKFYNRITAENKDKLNLSKMKFSVLGLGSTSQEKFCEASRLINKRLEELGAQHYLPYTTFDDQDKIDIEQKVDDYMNKLFNTLDSLKLENDSAEPSAKSSTVTSSTKNSGKQLNILFGTQCGLSEDVAALIGEEAQNRGYKVTVSGANQVPMDKFKSMDNVLVVTSTVDGTFPPSIFKFYNRITSEKLNLSNMNFSVLGLGSTSQEKFCEASRLINKRLEELGAQHYLPYTTFDDQDKIDIEQKVDNYLNKLFEALNNCKPRNVTVPVADEGDQKAAVTKKVSIFSDKNRKKAKAIANEKVLNIVYGTELGTTEATAKTIAKNAKEFGFVRVNLYEADNVDPYGLMKMKTVVFLMPTSDDGDFPPDARHFWERLSEETKENYDLSNMKYAVLGFGDSSYMQYCKASKFLDKKLNALGATRIQKFTVVDSNNIEQNPENVINEWQCDIFDKLGVEETDENGNRRDPYPSHSNGVRHNRARICELNIIHGTENGLAEDISEVIGEAALTHGFSEVTVCGANKILIEDLEKMKYVVVVTTTVDDVFPPSISYFWDRITDAEKNNKKLSNLKFTVLGLDNKKGEKFCEAARLINNKLEELGAERFFNYTTIDSRNEPSVEKELDNYIDNLYSTLGTLRTPSSPPFDPKPKEEPPVVESEKEVEVEPTPVKSSETPKESIHLLDVIFGTETGSCEAVADMISEDAKKAGIPEIVIHPADSVSLDDLKKMKYVTFVTSTSGEGEFPPNAIKFWNRLSKATKEDTSLADMKFTVLGLGDSSYSKFCEAARLINEKFEQLGGKRFYPYTTLDEQSGKDPEVFVNNWIQEVLKNLYPNSSEKAIPEKSVAKEPKAEVNKSKTPSPSINSEPVETLDVIFGTESGTSEAVADMISEDAQKAGIPEVIIHPADSVSLDELKNMKCVTFVTSTSGEGEFPPNAVEFWKRLSKATKEDTSLANMKFAVLGLGDSAYTKFCEAARLVNEKFEQLGAKRFFQYTTFDDQSNKDQEEFVNHWIQDILKNLKSNGNSNANVSTKKETVTKKAPVAKAPIVEPVHSLDVIFGTESGTCEAVADMISEDAQKAGIPEVIIHPADDVSLDELKNMKYVTFVTSTSGEGEFPPNAVEFWKRLSKATKEDTSLADMKFAVLGLGDSAYTKFCEAARLVNEKFEQLGAKRFYPYTTFDDQSDKDQEEFINQWIQNMLNNINGNSDSLVSPKTSTTSEPSKPLDNNETEPEIGERHIQKCDFQTEIHIIYGTKTNHSRNIANTVAEDAKTAGIPNIYVHEANNVNVDDLIKMKNIVFIAPTYTGILPEDSLQFWEKFSGKTLETLNMSETKYSVLGLGYRTSPRFCIATKAVNQKFQELKSYEFYPYTELDVENIKNPKQIIYDWSENLVNALIDVERPVDENDLSNTESEQKNIKKCDLQAELHVIFGTKSTHAEDAASMITIDAKDAGFPFVYCHEADTVKADDLPKMKNIVFITSTIDGSFPPDAVDFWKEFSQKSKDALDLSEIKYSVLGVGDKNRKDYCAAAKQLNQQFQKLGATEFYPYTEVDIEHSEDPGNLINGWSEKLLNSLIDIETREIEEDVGRRKLINDGDNQLNIIFGTESEHAQDVAGMLSDEAKEAGLTDINVFSADRIHLDDLRKMKTLVIVTSTFKGTFPPNALKFWERLNSVNKKTAGLKNMKYAVFGLGDSKQKKFCEAARLLDKKFDNLGARRFYKYTTLDVQKPDEELDVIEKWITEILKRINIKQKKN